MHNQIIANEIKMRETVLVKVSTPGDISQHFNIKTYAAINYYIFKIQ